MTTVQISVDDQTLIAQLEDNATARDLVRQLPLTLTFRDYHQVEKLATLPRPLSTEGAPDGAAPDVADVGYYAPSGDLVFYYGHVGYWPGIVRLGRFEGGVDVVRRQPDGFTVTLQLA